MSDVDTIRLLINAPADEQVFTNDQIQAFLDLEGGSVKRAAAQAIDTIADNEALVSKVMRTRAGVETDGAKVADALRKRAAALRAQADTEDADADVAAGAFTLVSPVARCRRGPELTERPYC